MFSVDVNIHPTHLRTNLGVDDTRTAEEGVGIIDRRYGFDCRHGGWCVDLCLAERWRSGATVSAGVSTVPLLSVTMAASALGVSMSPVAINLFCRGLYDSADSREEMEDMGQRRIRLQSELVHQPVATRSERGGERSKEDLVQRHFQRV